MRNLSLTARISLLFALAAALVLLVTGYVLARAVEAHFVEGDAHELDGKLALIRNLLARADTPAAFDHLPQQLDDALVGHHGLAVAVMDAGGRIWFASSGADFPRDLLSGRDCLQAGADVRCLPGGLWQWRQQGRDYRGKVAALPAGDGRPQTVAVVLDIAHHQAFMAGFRWMLALAMTLAALATAGLGWAAVRRGLAPLRRVTGLAAGISAQRLGERLPDQDQPRELRDLAAAFNAMLARLDDAFRRLSDFSSDIAHELRTPISNLMTQTQVALSGARDNEAYREILYSSLEEYERMAQMVGDMLYLAQADNGLMRPARETVDLAAEARGLMDYFGAWAEERGVALRLAGEARVAGDRLMLRRALSNLLANAVRHAPPGAAVDILLDNRKGEAVVSVANPGEDIPAEHLPRLFDRFYRVDPARQRRGDEKGEGSGLGLAIVKAIAETHGGRIDVASAGGRITFTLTLPAG